jgi:hypothetical protein
MTPIAGGGGTRGDSAKWNEYYADGPLESRREGTAVIGPSKIQIWILLFPPPDRRRVL